MLGSLLRCNIFEVLMGTDTGIYASFVMTVVAEEDDSRSIWPSCPAYGWSTGWPVNTSCGVRRLGGKEG